MRILSANASYGDGGIGQHFKQLVEGTREAGHLHTYLCPEPVPDDPFGRTLNVPWWEPFLLQYTPLRWSNSWSNHLVNERHDRQVADQLPFVIDGTPATRVMGFVGASLHSFEAARATDNEIRFELVAANSHVENVKSLHAQAAADTGISDTWLNKAQRQKTLQEYERADRIYVHSAYTARSFLNAGIDASRLVRTILSVDSRFQPPATRRPDDGPFRVVYVGRVDATKGIPLLFDALEHLDVPTELTLVGGWSTRAMRKYVQSRRPDLPPVHIRPGDPLPHLQRADVFVHPSYEDGFGYAPMEALACGVPVIVTEDTGMKEYVRNGENGYVVPTGSVDTIVEALETVHRTPLASTSSLLPPEYYTQTAASRGAKTSSTSISSSLAS